MRPLESLLADLVASGIEVIYSSNLVPPGLQVSIDDTEGDPLRVARAALASQDLELREIGRRRYVVARRPVVSPPVVPAVPVDAGPVSEVSVYASRYAIDGRPLVPALTLDGPGIDAVPGAHDDALRALRVLPGLAGNVSARPYIRGSLSEDVLVRYDGITLLDPYHLKNFQSLFSAIDPVAIDAIEVFSGGFPVRYGTRSGGVINLTAPTLPSGYENRIAVSAISAGLSTLGQAEKLPLEWLGAVRLSTLDQLEPVEDSLGKPQFSDSLGRLRWRTDNGAWLLGWLLLEDRLELGADDDEEFASARYRDEYFWLARDHRFSAALQTRASAVFTLAERSRSGVVDSPGVALGSLDEEQEFDRFEVTNDWSYDAGGGSSYSFGAELSLSRARYEYQREVSFAPEVASAFDRGTVDRLSTTARPRAVTYAAYLANRRQWADFEAEFGVRFDAQDFDDLDRRTQLSPRLNLRYDANRQTRLYASIGRFTQAQHVEDWRVEEGQARADPAQSSLHSVLGVTYETARAARWSVEVYSKRWTRVAPYFDSLLNPLSLLPDLAPDRVRLVPTASEASGLEVNARLPLADRMSAWGSISWSRVADDFDGHDVLRSWDQSYAVNAGFSWEGSRLSLSVLGSWHRGWPRTPYRRSAPTGEAAAVLGLDARNSARWADYYSLDLRGAWIWRLARGDLSATLELTNATNRANPCCSTFEGAGPARSFEVATEHWLPTIANLGFTYRWRGGE